MTRFLRKRFQVLDVLPDDRRVEFVARFGRIGFKMDGDVALSSHDAGTELRAKVHFFCFRTDGIRTWRSRFSVQRADFHRVFPRTDGTFRLSVSCHGAQHGAKIHSRTEARFPSPSNVSSPQARATFATMADLKRVTSLLEGDMAAFKPKFRAAVNTDVALLDTVMRYILRRKGKQMRPMFVFLSARLHGGVDGQGAATDRAHTAAALIELLHTATLVHDDVVDESPLRRGVFSIQALWKKKVAVLVEDYLLSRGLLAAVDARPTTCSKSPRERCGK